MNQSPWHSQSNQSSSSSVGPTSTSGVDIHGYRSSQLSSSPRPGAAKRFVRPLLISLSLLLAILAALILVLITRPVAPPDTWMADTTVGKEHILYYLHWDEQNGALHGKMETSLFADGSLHVTTWPFNATYDSDKHLLHMTFTNTLSTGLSKADAQIDGNTLTIKNANNGMAGNQSPQFHPTSTQEYDQAKQKLVVDSSNSYFFVGEKQIY